MRTELALLFPLIVTFACQGAPPNYAVERLALDGGSELVTIFRNTSADSKVPLLCLVRDTMGDADPENDRLRYLWLLNNARPAWWQRAVAAMPFFYGSAGGGRQDGLTPQPLIDLAAKHPKVWSDIGQASLQVWTFDPAGLALRASSRAYQGNLQNEQKSRFEQALAVIAAFEEQPESEGVFTAGELERLRARLLLGRRRLGGLVSESRFAQVSAGELREVEEARGRNWEILRQASESNGLWFDPLALGNREPNYALIWLRAGDAVAAGQPFDSQFLRIRDPWHDERLSNWKGYAREMESGQQMIPLALYDLEHPRAPLLLVDFRDNLKPKRREIFQRSVTDLMKSVFGLSNLRDWYYFLPGHARNFVNGRRGAALDPLARLRAYAKLKLRLGIDRSLDQPLREELQEQLTHLALNPLENDFEGEAEVAAARYEMLVKFAQQADGLSRKLDRDRSVEMRQVFHSRGTRLLLRTVSAASLGIYRHRERVDRETLAALDRQRRAEYHERFLEQVAASPRIEVDWDTDHVRRSIEFLSAHKSGSRRAELVGRVFARTQDTALRRTCLNELHRQGDSSSRRELMQLARLGSLEGEWRELCLLYAQEKRVSPGLGTAGGAAFRLAAP